MKPLPFTTKAEYIAWRTEWRANYAALSIQIREWKTKRKGKIAPLASSAKTYYCASEQSLAQCQCWILRKKAQQMLEDRKQSKVQAQSQYLAAKTAAPVSQI